MKQSINAIRPPPSIHSGGDNDVDHDSDIIFFIFRAHPGPLKGEE